MLKLSRRTIFLSSSKKSSVKPPRGPLCKVQSMKCRASVVWLKERLYLRKKRPVDPAAYLKAHSPM